MYKIEVFIDNRWAHYSWSRKEDNARKKFDKMKKRWAVCRVIYKGGVLWMSGSFSELEFKKEAK